MGNKNKSRKGEFKKCLSLLFHSKPVTLLSSGRTQRVCLSIRGKTLSAGQERRGCPLDAPFASGAGGAVNGLLVRGAGGVGKAGAVHSVGQSPVSST